MNIEKGLLSEIFLRLADDVILIIKGKKIDLRRHSVRMLIIKVSFQTS